MAATRFSSGESVRPWAWLWLLAVLCLLAAGPAEAKRAKKAVPDAKGAALGIYNTTQSLGLFLGGVAGGYVARSAGSFAVWMTCAALAVVWLIVGLGMTMPPPRSASRSRK